MRSVGVVVLTICKEAPARPTECQRHCMPESDVKPVPSMSRRQLLWLGAWPVLGGVSAAALAATASLQGRTLDGQPFSLGQQRGKVVLVMLWSTGCAVCRDMLPELRANYAGWQGKPFELVTVAVDTRREDVLAYETLLDRIVPMTQRFPSMWRRDPAHRDGFGTPSSLPASFVIDREGRVVEQHLGRLPAEIWDRIADLMP